MKAQRNPGVETAQAVREVKDLTPLIDKVSQSRIVMLGESTHGTQDFYAWRRLITEWLIVKHGFNFIAVEGDWPDCQAIHRYCQPEARDPRKNRNRTEPISQPASAREVLAGFNRWPTWMWANTEVLRLMEWLRTHNEVAAGEGASPVGFHGLDVYSLFDSIRAVTDYLDRTNPFLARLARRRYGCFENFHGDEIAYARSTFRMSSTCEDEVTQMLQDLLKLRADPEKSLDLFEVQQNARVIRNAEHYYRSMVRADDISWNVRDSHMLETLDELLKHHGPDSRCIVWAHNTHIGDYRATDMARTSLVNLGGLAREKYGEDDVSLVGFGTYEGQVIASHSWEGPVQLLNVPPARENSVERILHEASLEKKCNELLLTFGKHRGHDPWSEWNGHRAIGVVYDPKHESRGNYVPTSLSRRYDAFLFVDSSTAVEPLITSTVEHTIPETWPIGQ